MKLVFALCLAFLICSLPGLLTSAAYAQQVQYPAIKRNAQDLTDFVPPGWEIRDGTTGDLNKDGLADKALVLERSTGKGATNEQDSTASAVPRMLVVLFN